MEPIVGFILFAALLVIISMAGAVIPHIKVLSDNQAHLLVSLSAGIFLGLLFLMLLPEALHESEEAGFDVHTVMYVILAGFVLIMAIEVYLKHRNMPTCTCKECVEGHDHKVTTLSSFVGLSVHAICDGMVLAAAFYAGEEIGLVATVGMCIHKFVVLFSLSSTMILTDIDTRDAMKYLLGFAMLTPISGVLFFLLFGGMSLEGVIGLPLAFAAGTFMYVALCDMLPEAFHRRGQDLKSLLLVIAGIVLIALINYVFPHVH